MRTGDGWAVLLQPTRMMTFIYSFFPSGSGFPVFLPASGTAIDIRDVDACCRNSSRASELVICIYGRFSFQSMRLVV